MKNEIISSAEYKELQFLVTPQMKYRNQKTTVDGIVFDSKREAEYYGKLKLLLKSGDVLSFERQVIYPFELNGVKIGSYKSDFDVVWKTSGLKVTDCKGFATDLYKWKKKMMLAFYGITIKEVYRTCYIKA